MTKKTKALEVEVLPPEKELLSEEFRHRFESAYEGAVSGVRRILTFGLICIEAKQSLPHGHFKKWIEMNCPGINYKTVNSFRALTEAIFDALGLKSLELQTFGVRPEELFLDSPGKLPKKVARIRESILNVVDGKSQKQLELEFGIRKPKKGKLVGKGDTNNPEGKNGWAWQKDPIECEKRAWTDFFGSRDIAMIDEDSFLGTVRSHRRSTFWHHLPVAARHKIAEELIGLSNEIQATYQETLSTAKKAKKAQNRKK